jgi:RHS repeat-associated protein
MAYAGNKLIGANDAVTTVTGNYQFHEAMVSTVVEGNTSTHEYLYDVNGNMKEDKNKGITVVYNYLNLPIQVNFDPNNRIDWTYTATGAKLQKKVYTNGSLTLTQDYVSGFVYKNGSLDFFSTETGRVKNQSGTLKYQYTLTDHLGNTRVMFADTNNNGSPEIIEESHYYAFGMRIEGLSTTNPDNKFTYNGKELEDDHGLNWYHYGARFYDAQIGRWHSVDILDEFNSPYCYVGNNPLSFVDPDGNGADDANTTILLTDAGDKRADQTLFIRNVDPSTINLVISSQLANKYFGAESEMVVNLGDIANAPEFGDFMGSLDSKVIQNDDGTINLAMNLHFVTEVTQKEPSKSPVFIFDKYGVAAKSFGSHWKYTAKERPKESVLQMAIKDIGELFRKANGAKFQMKPKEKSMPDTLRVTPQLKHPVDRD